MLNLSRQGVSAVRRTRAARVPIHLAAAKKPMRLKVLEPQGMTAELPYARTKLRNIADGRLFE
jgi:hypothetical protein